MVGDGGGDSSGEMELRLLNWRNEDPVQRCRCVGHTSRASHVGDSVYSMLSKRCSNIFEEVDSLTKLI